MKTNLRNKNNMENKTDYAEPKMVH